MRGAFFRVYLTRQDDSAPLSISVVVDIISAVNACRCLGLSLMVFGNGEKENISKADTNALAKRAAALKVWAKERHEEWQRQLREL